MCVFNDSICLACTCLVQLEFSNYRVLANLFGDLISLASKSTMALNDFAAISRAKFAIKSYSVEVSRIWLMMT